MKDLLVSISKTIVLFFIPFLVLLSCPLRGQTSEISACNTGRYTSEIFSSYNKATIQYGSNNDVLGNSISLYMDIYTPQGDTALHRPLVIFAFGGGFMAGDKSTMEAYCAQMAKRGFVAASIQYRLWPSTTLGTPDSVEMMRQAVMAMGDMKAAVRHFRMDAATVNTYKVNPNWIFVGGYSAGAITALMTGHLDYTDPIATYIRNAIDTEGGINGNTGSVANQSYSSAVSGVINMSGGLNNTAWIDAQDVPTMSLHGTIDDVVYYNYGLAAGIVYLNGSGNLQPRLNTLGIPNLLRGVSGLGHGDLYTSPAYESEVLPFFQDASVLMHSLFCSAPSGTTALSGTVFRDFNGNGVKDTNEPGVLGVTVKAYNASGTQVGSTATSAVTTGAWSITTGTTATVRVEFQIPTNASGQDYTAESGATYGSSVQFVAGNATGVNFGINNPDDYWNNTTQPIPQLMLPCYVSGTVSGANKDEPAIVRFGNDQNGLAITKTVVAKISEVGTVWGNAYQKSKDRFFYSSFLKRHSGFGTLGTGGVYMVEKVSSNYAVEGSFNLQGVVPSNSGTALDMGSVTRVTTPTTADNYLSNSASNKSEPSRDLDAFGKIGKVSFGDADIDEANNQLILVNLFNRQLITVDVSGGTSALNGASAATLAPLTKAYNIMSLTGLPSCVNGDLRPWGLKLYKGKGYLGVVCNGNNGVAARSIDNVKGYILSFDPQNIGAGFATVLTLNLKYTTSFRWNPWADTWAQTGLATTTPGAGVYLQHFQPIISDIEFDEKGGMTIAVMDRFGHQMGNQNYIAAAGNTNLASGAGLGDLLYACYDATLGTWTMEGGTGCTPNQIAPLNEGYSGTGTKEWYYDTTGDNAGEGNGGSVAKIMGTGNVVSIVEDPHPNGTVGATYFATGGVQWFNNTTGSYSQYAQIFNNSTFLYGKATGLGDIEAALNPAPIEIGNRVWNDTNKNGIQDANESGIGNVTIELYADFDNNGTPDGAALATTTTSTTAGNTLGTWYFNASNVTDGDPSVAGNQAGLAVNKKYLVRIGSADWTGGAGVSELATLALTTTNATPTAGLSDVSDNDATLSSTIPTIAYSTGSYGQNNHTLDFGFSFLCDTTLTVTNTTICSGTTVDLFTLASGVKGTLTYSTNGTTWTALTSPTNVPPSVTTTYYVKDTLVSGCFDVDTLVITVNPQPTTPSVSSPIMNICPLTTVDLTTISSALTPSVSGGVFEWRVSNSSSSAMVSNQNTVGAGDYYLFERSPAGCYSVGLKVTTTINICCPPKICLPVTVTRNN